MQYIFTDCFRWQKISLWLTIAWVLALWKTPTQLAAASIQHGDAPLTNVVNMVQPAMPQSETFTVRVIIEQVDAISDFDGGCNIFWCDQADFFAVVRIGQHVQRTDAIGGQNHIVPNWQLSHDTLVPNLTDDSIPVTIDIRDSDGDPFCPDYSCHNQADITADPNRELNLNVDVSACAAIGASSQISGAVSGTCGQTIVSTGTATDNRAEIRFRIEVERPASAAGAVVRCLHSPIWPQGGESIKVTAEVLNNSLGATYADRMEIWFDNVLNKSTFGHTTMEHSKLAPISGASFTYRCIAKVGETTVSSGWHRVQVGAPPVGRAIPVLFVGERRASVDIVIVPATSDYPNIEDRQFQEHVYGVIKNSFYAEKVFLEHQRQVNFWIGKDFGTANGYGNGTCVIPPNNWGGDYAFVEAGMILHKRALRDCAIPAQRIFSSEYHEYRTVLHEAGHAVFGLTDEYSDNISYGQNNPYPNVYAGASACSSDIISLQPYDIRLGLPPRTSANCLEIRENWFRSDPEDDLMKDGGKIQGADLRRIEWVFNETCKRNACGNVLASEQSTETEDLLPQFDYDDLHKIFKVDLRVANDYLTASSNSTFFADSSEVVIAPPPASRFADPPMWKIDLHTNNVAILESPVFSATWWNPSIEKGVFHFECHSEVCIPKHDSDILRNETDTSIVVPFLPQAGVLEIFDAVQESAVISINLELEVEDYCRTNRDDQDCNDVDITIPIEALNAINNGPMTLGQIALLTATVISGENVTYQWDFGDGATGSGISVQHSYAKAGNYIATVTATNSQGSVTAQTLVIIINPSLPEFKLYLPVVQRQ